MQSWRSLWTQQLVVSKRIYFFPSIRTIVFGRKRIDMKNPSNIVGYSIHRIFLKKTGYGCKRLIVLICVNDVLSIMLSRLSLKLLYAWGWLPSSLNPWAWTISLDKAQPDVNWFLFLSSNVSILNHQIESISVAARLTPRLKKIITIHITTTPTYNNNNIIHIYLVSPWFSVYSASITHLEFTPVGSARMKSSWEIWSNPWRKLMMFLLRIIRWNRGLLECFL